MEKSEQLKQVISDEKLAEPVPGFFAFPESSLAFKAYDNIALAVHAPYYREDKTGSNPHYGKAIDDFVSKEDRPIIFALNEIRFDGDILGLKQALGWIKSLGASKRSLIYFTIPMDSQPMERWKAITSGIKQAFSPGLIDVVGAELMYTWGDELAYSGCVNGTINNLKNDFAVKPLPQYCWTNRTYVNRKPGRYSEDDKFEEYQDRIEYLKERFQQAQKVGKA